MQECPIKKEKSFRFLACRSLLHSLTGQSTGGGDSGTNTKSASEERAVTRARYLGESLNENLILRDLKNH